MSKRRTASRGRLEAALAVSLMGTEKPKLVAKDIHEACQQANYLASLAVQEPGVSLPDLSKLWQFEEVEARS